MRETYHGQLDAIVSRSSDSRTVADAVTVRPESLLDADLPLASR